MTGRSPEPTGTIEVRLLGFPLDVYQRSREYLAGLLRELELIRLGEGPDSETPRRLLALSSELIDRFRGFTASVGSELEEAERRGDLLVDLTYRTVPAVADAAQRLDQLLDEADDYSRAGREVLTLASPPEEQAFRRWLLGEFVGQIGGATPIPWASFDRSRSVS